MADSEWKNKLYYGDNIVWLRDHDRFPNESVDLVYLDPPFNSNADYNVIFNEPGGGKSQAQIRAFDDTWHWEKEASVQALGDLGEPGGRPELVELIQWIAAHGDKPSKSVAAYLSMMAVRLVELHRILKYTGSLYLHCDPTASHYLKVVLDSIFGKGQFRNEITWRRTGGHGKARRYAPIHDTILFYSKTDAYKWIPIKKPYMKGHVEQYFVHDKKGWRTNYYGNVLTGSGLRGGESGKPWHGFDPSAKGRHWAIPGQIIDEIEEDTEEDLSALGQHQKLDRLLELGYIKIVDGQAWPIYERYIKAEEGQAAPDLWAFQPYTSGTVFGTDKGIDDDVRWLSPNDQERLGFQTQKPVGLLERILKASSESGDIVLDPFCGCGTTVVAAQSLGRRWIGIDVTWLAIDKIERRLTDSWGKAIEKSYKVEGMPYDVASARALAEKNKKEFEIWAIWLVGATARERDGGVDGLLSIVEGKDKVTKVIVQVKGGKNLNPGMVRDLMGTVEKENAAIGLMITLYDPTSGMIETALHQNQAPYESPIWEKSYPRIQLRTIKDLLIDGKGFDLPPQGNILKKAMPAKERADKPTLL